MYRIVVNGVSYGSSTETITLPFKTVGTYSFIIPAGVTSITVDVAGGGGGGSGYGECSCDDYSSYSCFTSGTEILCYSNELKYYSTFLENIKPGDYVIGANNSKNKVLAIIKTILGKYRNMYTFSDNSLHFTGDHMFWVKQNNKEYFGVHDYSCYMRGHHTTVGCSNMTPNQIFLKARLLEQEIDPKSIKELSILPMPIYSPDIEYGTIAGWLKKKVEIDRTAENNTEVYSLIVDNNHTFYANGYLVAGGPNNDNYDYNNIKIESNGDFLFGKE